MHRLGSKPSLTIPWPAHLRLPAGVTTASARAAPEPGASMRQRGHSLREAEPRARQRSAPIASSSAPTPRLSVRVTATQRRPSCRRRASTPRRLRRAVPTTARAVAAAVPVAALRSRPISSAPVTRRRTSMANVPCFCSGSQGLPTHCPCRACSGLPTWAQQEERPCRLDAGERLRRCARSVADSAAVDHSGVHRRRVHLSLCSMPQQRNAGVAGPLCIHGSG